MVTMTLGKVVGIRASERLIAAVVVVWFMEVNRSHSPVRIAVRRIMFDMRVDQCDRPPT